MEPAALRRDGRLVAIDSRSWLVHRREVGAAYRTELAHELVKIGFQIRRGVGRGGRYFELDGVPQALLDRWSSRRLQVQAAVQERLSDQRAALTGVIAAGGPAATEAAEHLKLLNRTGLLSPKQERTMATATRNAKAPVTTEDLDSEWRHTGLRLGLSRERIDVLRHHPDPSIEAASESAVLGALTEFDATFPARDARAVALEQSAGAPIQAALDQLRALRMSDDILVLADGTGTTRAHRGKERTVVAITERLASARLEALPAAVTARETEQLNQELTTVGGRLSDEQRAAIAIACGEHPLVVIEGQAGTGKSTTLTGIARAHQACGREIIVTSTAALAAERLAGDLAQAGLTCTAYSTAALHAAVETGRVQLTPGTTVIHDEAALASTNDQLHLLDSIETSGARLIAVGDPRQNQPVGAGGLWNHIQTTVRDADALVELTRNQRARDPADRRDQAWLREGRVELAIRSYAARDRVHLDPDQRRVEDQALDAAHTDRTLGRSTIVIAQTSNEHLDELNARAQAIRRQHRQLGDESVPVPGRPYELHAGDVVQVRRTIRHPDHGQLRNGTSAVVADVDPASGWLDLRLADGTTVRVDERQLADADLRLAYVQHPFPAQGHTTDAAHVIVAPGATREGSYVALTRAREETYIYAADSADRQPDVDRLQDLADRIGRTEPELPAIHAPLAHEATVAEEINNSTIAPGQEPARIELQPEPSLQPAERAGESLPGAGLDGARGDESSSAHDTPTAETVAEADALSIESSLAIGSDQSEHAKERVWPRASDRDLRVAERTAEQRESDEAHGWEM